MPARSVFLPMSSSSQQRRPWVVFTAEFGQELADVFGRVGSQEVEAGLLMLGIVTSH